LVTPLVIEGEETKDAHPVGVYIIIKNSCIIHYTSLSSHHPQGPVQSTISPPLARAKDFLGTWAPRGPENIEKLNQQFIRGVEADKAPTILCNVIDGNSDKMPQHNIVLPHHTE
jgi:hypothetical protein